MSFSKGSAWPHWSLNHSQQSLVSITHTTLCTPSLLIWWGKSRSCNCDVHARHYATPTGSTSILLMSMFYYVILLLCDCKGRHSLPLHFYYSNRNIYHLNISVYRFKRNYMVTLNHGNQCSSLMLQSLTQRYTWCLELLNTCTFLIIYTAYIMDFSIIFF